MSFNDHRPTTTEGSRLEKGSSPTARWCVERRSHWPRQTGRCPASVWGRRERQARFPWLHLQWPGGCWRCRLEQYCTASLRLGSAGWKGDNESVFKTNIKKLKKTFETSCLKVVLAIVQLGCRSKSVSSILNQPISMCWRFLIALAITLNSFLSLRTLSWAPPAD